MTLPRIRSRLPLRAVARPPPVALAVVFVVATTFGRSRISAFRAGAWSGAARLPPSLRRQPTSAEGRRLVVPLVPRRAEPQPWDPDYPKPPKKVYDDDFSDSDIERFYQETTSGAGGPVPPGRFKDLVTQYFTWDAHLRKPGQVIDPEEEHNKAFETMKEQLRQQTWRTYGGPRGETPDDGKGWVWLAAEMTVVGLCLQIYTSIPYGRRPLLVAKSDGVDEMFEKVNWAKADERLDDTLGTLLRIEQPTGDEDVLPGFEGYPRAPRRTDSQKAQTKHSTDANDTLSVQTEDAPPPAPRMEDSAPAPVTEDPASLASPADEVQRAPSTVDAQPSPPAAATIDARRLVVPELRDHLRALGLDDTGTKTELVQRLEAAQKSA